MKDPLSTSGLFVINHSGGKDSQAMTNYLREHVPTERILVIHAHLPEVEWPGTWEHVQDTCKGLTILKVQATKTFFEMVDHRRKFPGPQYRQCTSDLKRGPIEKAVRQYMKEKAYSLVYNCMGIRREESCSRAKLKRLKLNKRNSKAVREWYDWLPIFDYTLDDVWENIRRANQQPHWAYSHGITRLSCCFCIMANDADLRTAAKCNPELYRKYVLKEREHAFTLRQGIGLEEIVGVPVEHSQPNPTEGDV